MAVWYYKHLTSVDTSLVYIHCQKQSLVEWQCLIWSYTTCIIILCACTFTLYLCMLSITSKSYQFSQQCMSYWRVWFVYCKLATFLVKHCLILQLNYMYMYMYIPAVLYLACFLWSCNRQEEQGPLSVPTTDYDRGLLHLLYNVHVHVIVPQCFSLASVPGLPPLCAVFCPCRIKPRTTGEGLEPRLAFHSVAVYNVHTVHAYTTCTCVHLCPKLTSEMWCTLYMLASTTHVHIHVHVYNICMCTYKQG